MKAKIMVVDDSVFMLNLIGEVLDAEYELILCEGAEQAMTIIEKTLPDFIILDINMPHMDGFEFFEWLKKFPRTSNIPVIFLSGADRNSSEFRAIDAGAMDYIAKPFTPAHLKKRVALYANLILSRIEIEEKNRQLENYANGLKIMVDHKTKEILALRDAIFLSVGDIVESRDRVTGGHNKRSAEYIRTLATACRELSVYSDQLSEENIDYLIKAAPMHDIGKIEIPDSILLKPGKLTIEEFEIMKKHAYYGYHMLEKISKEVSSSMELQMGMEIALTHHEKWDGSGYPQGLVQLKIPLSGRLMAIADVYDALVTIRPYKEKYTHGEAVKIIVDDAGKHFDPYLVSTFLSVTEEFEHIAIKYQD